MIVIITSVVVLGGLTGALVIKDMKNNKGNSGGTGGTGGTG